MEWGVRGPGGGTKTENTDQAMEFVKVQSRNSQCYKPFCLYLSLAWKQACPPFLWMLQISATIPTSSIDHFLPSLDDQQKLWCISPDFIHTGVTPAFKWCVQFGAWPIHILAAQIYFQMCWLIKKKFSYRNGKDIEFLRQFGNITKFVQQREMASVFQLKFSYHGHKYSIVINQEQKKDSH